MPRLTLVKSYRLLDSARFDAIKMKRLEKL